jgi:hypothetical protein
MAIIFGLAPLVEKNNSRPLQAPRQFFAEIEGLDLSIKPSSDDNTSAF